MEIKKIHINQFYPNWINKRRERKIKELLSSSEWTHIATISGLFGITYLFEKCVNLKKHAVAVGDVLGEKVYGLTKDKSYKIVASGKDEICVIDDYGVVGCYSSNCFKD